MKVILIILASVTTFVITISLLINHFEKPYKVRIEFCDDRIPITTTVEALKEPSRYSISNINKGVPSYEGYLNVCDVTVVK